MTPESSAPSALEVRGLWKTYATKSGREVTVLRDVSFTLEAGECLGIAGESGSGKSTLARTLMRAHEPSAGSLSLRVGEQLVDFGAASGRRLRMLRPSIQMVFQDPFSSLDPRMTIFDIVAEPLRINRLAKGQELTDRVHELLRMVGLRADAAERFPHAFSGGQRQRIGIARAIASRPGVVICDEAVSALDVSVQAQVLNLLEDIRRAERLSLIFISHDLSVLFHISDRIAIMYAGRIVEIGPTEQVFARPRHPYTSALIGSIPRADLKRREPPLRGEAASHAALPPGCPFHPRCAHTVAICSSVVPEHRVLAAKHEVACHRSNELELSGIAARPRPDGLELARRFGG